VPEILHGYLVYGRFTNHYSGDDRCSRELGQWNLDGWVASIVEALRAVKATTRACDLQNEFYEKGETPARYETVASGAHAMQEKNSRVTVRWYGSAITRRDFLGSTLLDRVQRCLRGVTRATSEAQREMNRRPLDFNGFGDVGGIPICDFERPRSVAVEIRIFANAPETVEISGRRFISRLRFEKLRGDAAPTALRPDASSVDPRKSRPA